MWPRRSKEQPVIGTSSLPDIVFMLLFFFMVVTVIRPPLVLDVELTSALNIKKLERKDARLHLYMANSGNDLQIQLNDQLFSLDQLKWKLDQLPPKQLDSDYLVVLELDEQLDMGNILDLQSLLREKGISKIIYKTLATPQRI